MRSVRHYLPEIQDPQLRARVEVFIGQEAQHQRAHLQAFSVVEQQGYEIQSFLRWYEHLAYTIIEPRTSPQLRLSTTAALEHFTATFGELALSTEMLDIAHPSMRSLLKWHAAEEIEHRDVAFDVLQLVAPGWGLRCAGFLLAGGTLFFFLGRWGEASRKQDKEAALNQGSQRVRDFWRRNGPSFGRRIFAYLKPGFHPLQAESDTLAEQYLREMA